MKKFLIPITIFAALGILLWKGLSMDPRRIPSPLVGKPLPAFNLPSLKEPAKRLANADFRGKPVMINVWASWCTACKQEHPVLVDIARQNVVLLVGLNYKDQREEALAVLKADGDPYSVSLADVDGRTGINWGVYGVPETFVVDKDGIIRYKHIGPITPESWEKDLLPIIRSLS